MRSANLVNWRLTIEYAGTRYRGWQQQPGERTVAGELLAAARDLLGEAVDLGGSGRTDAGVHALGQVAHLKCRKTNIDLASALNERLPADIHVLSAEPAPASFHARHSAVARSYLYQISRRRQAFLKPFVWWVREPLDVPGMARAAESLRGMHDFAAFSEPDPQTRSTKVDVLETRVVPAGDLLLLRFAASHFLWKMVRRLTGALVRVGAGKMREAEYGEMLRTGQGSVAEWTAPPSGLFLERVLYGGDRLGPPAPALTLGGGKTGGP